MKNLKYIFAALILSLSLISCSDNDEAPNELNPVEGLNKIYDFSGSDHSIEIYSEKMEFEVGYNEVSIRIKDQSSGDYLRDAEVSWMPMMHMESMAHSAPHSGLSNAAVSNTVYKGYIVFQMAGNDTEYWELQLAYQLNGEEKNETFPITVKQPADESKKVQVFVANDNKRYVLAYVNPREPQVAVNDFQAVLYEMENMMTFTPVEDYKITIDPRMPGMGNHSSPNNQDLVYNSTSGLYEGKLALTMTGYWKINLKLLNPAGETLKGEEVTEEHPESSLYFELEF